MDLGRARDAESKGKAEDCLLPKMIGPCKMSRPSFYYDTEKGDCLPFIYGGCRVKSWPYPSSLSFYIKEVYWRSFLLQGNGNRFETRETCLETCSASASGTRIIRIESQTGHQGVTTLPINLGGIKGVSTLPIALSRSRAVASTRPDVCLQPKKTGPCRGLETNYFFDVTKEKCVAFNYGGCEVNSIKPFIYSFIVD